MYKIILRKLILWIVSLALWVTLLPTPAYAYANATVTVKCGTPGTAGEQHTISGALKILTRIATTGRKTVLISGTCNENVVVDGFDHLTLQGNPTAIINGHDLATNVALFVTDSQDVAVNNISVVGGATCNDHSLCRFNNDTFQDASVEQFGFGVFSRSSAVLIDCTIQNNGGLGVFIGFATRLDLDGGTVQNNGGDGIATPFGGGRLIAQPGIATNPIVQNNSGNGISANLNSMVDLLAVTVIGNAGDGLRLTGSSTATIRNGSAITQNIGHGVRIGDLSFVEFSSDDTVVGNNTGVATPYDVICDPVNSATRRLGSLTGTKTNCPAEQPINP